MRNLVILMLSLLISGPAWADEALENVITQQFDAFRADDLDRAFSYASPMIQGYFGTPETFGRMVAQGYPQIRDPGDIAMRDLRQEGGRLLQRVQVFDANGLPHLFDYEMIETGDGWKINGVRYVGAPPMSV